MRALSRPRAALDPSRGRDPARPRTGGMKAELSARDRVLRRGTCTTNNRRASDRFQRLPTERSCSPTGFQHAIRGQQGRVQLRPICRPAKRSALLAQSYGCLDRLPQRRKIMIASHRLASTWSRRASTQCGERSWIAECDLFKVRLKSGTYHEIIRPSGHRAVSPEHGTDRWAGPVRRGPGRHLRPVPAGLKSKAYLK